jgi:sulfate adenylyltransferase subunit 1
MLAQAELAPAFEIDSFLAGERAKDLLRFSTAGSVDDGKSTLIGRLLYDSRSVYEDQIKSIAKSTINRSAGAIDLSLLTDGLRAEREQGITIDVAYRYFATARRKFIIADTPGHEQYTRNMATGASTADLAIVLIDARNGVMQQSRRHAYIASLLGIPKIVVAVNKMDLVDFSEDVFRSIVSEFGAFLGELGIDDVWFAPLSALTGDNVVTRGAAMPWFNGPSLLEFLETVEIPTPAKSAAFRLPVQRVIRPDQHFRGYAGQIASGVVHPGDAVTVWPSGRSSRVKSIETFDGQLARAGAPMSVTLTLEDEVDISRGDLISAGERPHISRAFDGRIVWMSESPLDTEKQYLLKHTTQTVPARVSAVQHRIDIRTLEREANAQIEMNGIGRVSIETTRAINFDSYAANRITGAAILIDPSTNITVGALMIEKPLEYAHAHGPVTSVERATRFGHGPAAVFVGQRESLAQVLERRLFDRCSAVAVIRQWTSAVEKAMIAAGILCIVVNKRAPSLELPPDDERAADLAVRWLEQRHAVNTEHEWTDGEGI